jgi:chemotaxis protein MotB
MKIASKLLLFVMLISLGSCVSKKKYTQLENELSTANTELSKSKASLEDYMSKFNACDQELASLKNTLKLRQEQIDNLREQVEDLRRQRDRNLEQVGDLTALSKAANESIRETLSQMEGKDKYIRLLQSAKTKADSINLALSSNLKSVLKDGIDDKDIDIVVDKTVVFINISDKMLFNSGSANLTPRASDVLGKIARIIESRPDLEVMVEGYTDNMPIKTACIEDNWDLSVKRSTSVVRTLQKKFKVDPNRLIAAGRGEYNILTSNETREGRAMNRRTRIILMPKMLDQFYDLLDPSKASN